MTSKKVVFYITKTKDSNGNVRFTVKATFPDSEFKPRSKELWEGAYVIGKPKHKNEEEKLAKEFHFFFMEALAVFELHKVYNERANFTMKFGDEYSAWCSVLSFVTDEESELKNKTCFQVNAATMNVPLNEKEINFFWECLARPILIH